MSFSISLPNHRKKIFLHASPFPEIKFSSSEGRKKAFLIIIRIFKENKKINGRIKMRKLFFPDSNLVLIAIEKKFTDCFSLSIPSLPPRKLSSALLQNLTSFCWWFVKILLSNQVRREMGHRRRTKFPCFWCCSYPFRFPSVQKLLSPPTQPHNISLRTTFSALSNESLNTFMAELTLGFRSTIFWTRIPQRASFYRRSTK